MPVPVDSLSTEPTDMPEQQRLVRQVDQVCQPMSATTRDSAVPRYPLRIDS
jgi:hypothetical protein